MMRITRTSPVRLLSLPLLATLGATFGLAAVDAFAERLPLTAKAGSGGPAAQYQNLQVLPADISRDELSGVMLVNLSGLGLPRRDGEGCLYCHMGDFDEPRDSWDYASDDKLAKRKARAMMAMVASINSDHLAGLEGRLAEDLEVTCTTCHAGRTDPRPLPDVIMETYRADGVSEAIARYQRLRSRYFGADAYDFRSVVLARLAGQIAGSGAFDDAIALASANAEVYPEDGTANGAVLTLELQQSYAGGGVEPALELFDALRASDRSRWVDFSLLDSLGWAVFRRGNEESAVTIFRGNLERFPDQYIPHESLADAFIFAEGPLEDRQAGIALYEAWVQRHPDHETALRRLAALRQQNR